LKELTAIIENTKSNKSGKEYLEAIDQYNALQAKQKQISLVEESSVYEPLGTYKRTGKFSLSTFYVESNIESIMSEFITDNCNKYRLSKNDNNPSNTDIEEFDIDLKDDYLAFYQCKDLIQQRFNLFVSYVKNLNYSYLGASLSKQSALFSIRDKENSLAQAIHDYKQLGIDKDTGSEAYLFVKRWMSVNQFDIGESMEINLHAGEAYEIEIFRQSNGVTLSDLGTGSIQAMLLILRIACIIYKVQNKTKTSLLLNINSEKVNKIEHLNRKTIIIEEPELNLHPAMQSKLADLFHEVYTKYGIQLIVETHSEYLIRKTQLIVKDNEYEVKPNENPFTVIYFDCVENKQWEMEYREDGKFSNEFGEGFYDVASQQAMKLLSKAK
jgi:hypothetical protein